MSLIDSLIAPIKSFNETAIREDFKKIAVALEISPERIPILILKPNMKNSYYRYGCYIGGKWYPPEVHLGLANLPFPRSILVHELVHGVGVSGHGGSFSSYTSRDKASLIIEKLIFGNRVKYDKRGNRAIV